MGAIEEVDLIVKSACIKMDKKASVDLSGWAKYVMNSIGQNKITGAEALRSALIGAAVSSVAGAGIGALTGKKGKKLKRSAVGAIIGALAGGAAGPVYAQLRKYLDGVPFDNSAFEKAEHKKGDRVYIGVSGSANGENESYFRGKMRDEFGPGNTMMLRHVDANKIQGIYDKLKEKGLDVTVVGHSSGAAAIGKFLKNNPNATGYMIDPVSWTGRVYPENALIFTSDESTRHRGEFENVVADVGGRWNYVGPNSITFKGSHSGRIGDILRHYVSKKVAPGQASEVPSYVTNVYGNPVAGGK